MQGLGNRILDAGHKIEVHTAHPKRTLFNSLNFRLYS